MEHDSSRSGYHEHMLGDAEHYEENEDWGDDFPKQFSINLIWAQAQDMQGRSGVIGFEGSMPWHLSEDLKRFKELTVSHPVIMGRKTWESLGKHSPLPNRDNIVVSHDETYRAAGASVAPSIEAALDYARQEAIPDDGIDRSEIWVIGGTQLFEQLLPQASRVYVTQIQARVPADTYAPDMDELVEHGEWQISELTDWMKPANATPNIGEYRYITYEHSQQESEGYEL
ncbi:MAG: dihydrofolate reductase [Bifidobacteriaceae bacterium]|nr:dihydrofolate reductase [Bifidobacteriaceae bacterium]